MIIFWGSKVRKELLDSGEFFCTYCGARREYRRVRVVDQTYVYYLFPVGKGKDLGEVAECSDCGTMHKTDAIEEAERLEDYFTLSAIRIRLQLGSSKEGEIDRLIRKGHSDTIAIDMVLAAISLNRELEGDNGGVHPDEKHVRCLVCARRLELLDHQVTAGRFTCPICDTRWLFAE